MKTRPIEPALIDFGAGGGIPPRSPLYDDLYHPRIGALQQAQHVFLQGNGLPERWRGRSNFVVLETGFGLGNNFLATWDAWRRDAARSERLFFVSIERHPPSAADLARAHAHSALPDLARTLQQAWPPLTPNLHLLEFDGRRVQLLLALGDVATLLPGLRLRADAFYLDGFAPVRNPDMWQPRVIKALGRLAAPGATLATWSVARSLLADLTSAGFVVQLEQGIGGKREITVAHFSPGHQVPRLPHAAAAGRTAVVVGAGIAGGATAQALARLGMEVTVFDRCAQAASEGSGNPAGLFHGTVNGDDGTYARLFRAAALVAQSGYAQVIATGTVSGSATGLLRLGLQDVGWPAMQALLQRQGLPADYVRALSTDEATALAGVLLPGPAWHYPGGGWLSPAEFVRQTLQEPGVRFVASAEIAAISRSEVGWQLKDSRGRLMAQAGTVVLANAGAAAGLLAPLGHRGWPLHHTRGQVTYWNGACCPLRLPVAGDGYVIPLPDGLLCGATRQVADPGSAELRHTDHLENLQRLHRLTGVVAPADTTLWQGRSGWRLHAADRLPIAGALPLMPMPTGQRLDQARLLPREGGLFVLSALGARGLTLAPLLARLVAAQATGTPWPLEQDLADAIDPGRWQVRGARMSTTDPR